VAVLLNLDRLTLNAAAQTLGVVSGEQTPSAYNLLSNEYFSLDVREGLSTFLGNNEIVPCLNEH